MVTGCDVLAGELYHAAATPYQNTQLCARILGSSCREGGRKANPTIKAVG